MCNEKFDILEAMEEHRRRAHKDAVPNAENGK
jgi:hypothetical protein